MQVTIASTSSMLDDSTVLIETAMTIGEQTTTQRVGYDKQELMDNRFLAGTFEERVEALRKSAERMTEASVRIHFQTLAKIAEQPAPTITEVPTVEAQAEPVTPAKKTRAKRTTKTTTESAE